MNTEVGLPFPSPGDLPDSGVEPTSLMFPALARRFFTTSPPNGALGMLFELLVPAVHGL